MITDLIDDWLLTEAPALPSCRHVLQGLKDRLNAEGLQLHRAVLGVDVLHPKLMAKAFTWERGGRYVIETEIHHDIETTDQYLAALSVQ